MRLLVCGGRDFSDADALFKTLDRIHARLPVLLLIEGGARGADRIARSWAVSRKVPVQTYEANWVRYGRRAGPLRNQQMIIANPDLVVAFAGDHGTANMVRLARTAGIAVLQAPSSV